MILGLQFAACAAVILLTGVRLTQYGDVIADRSGLGRTWVGVVLVAAATSLPELVTGASAVAFHDLPDIAAGDILGSCLFNLLILAVVSARDPRPLSAVVHQGNLIPAAFGVVLIAIAALALAGAQALPAFLAVSAATPVLFLTYMIAMKVIYDIERNRTVDSLPDVEAAHALTLRQASLRYALNAAILVAAASYLPVIGERIAEATGLGQTFVGTAFIAATTSAPEIVVSVVAVRIGAIDLAAGNLLGSNLFNIALLGLDDVLYRPGSLFAAVSPSHLLPALGAVVMSGLAVFSLAYVPARARRVPWEAVGMIGVYAATMIMLS